MAAESWVLDGVALTSGNFTMLELNVDPPKARPDWITGADTEGSALMRQPQYENRTITMTLRVAAQASMDVALDQVGVIRDKLRLASQTPDGIDLVWTPQNATQFATFSVIAGEITGLPVGLSDHAYSWFQRRPIFTVEMTAKPYWYGTETLTSTASSGVTPFATLVVSGVTGDVPALGRLIVTDLATQSRKHVEWGIEGQFYDAATSLIVESDNMSVTGLAGTGTTRTGAYDPGAVGNSVIRTTLTTSAVACCSTGNLGHVGVFRVKARVYATTTDVQVRLAWRSGDNRLTANAFDPVPVANAFAEVDLGIIIIPQALVGTQRWTGQIEAFSATAGDTVDVDYLELIPCGEGYGKARGETFVETVTAFSGRDEFNQTAGALSGKVAPVGGTWATAGVPAVDFQVGTSGAYRSSVSDASIDGGRWATLGTSTFTDVLVQAVFSKDGVGFANTFDLREGLVARYTDTSNFVFCGFEVDYISPGASIYMVRLLKEQAGVITILGTYILPAQEVTFLGWLRLVIDTSGNASVFYGPSVTSLVRIMNVTNAGLATGGALATGKVGLYDAWTGSGTGLNIGRYVNNFSVAVPTPPQVIFSGRQLQVRHDDTVRQDATGVYTGRPPAYRGTRFMVPPGTSRVFVKARRQDIDTTADDVVTDATQIQVGWTPRGLVVPR